MTTQPSNALYDTLRNATDDLGLDRDDLDVLRCLATTDPTFVQGVLFLLDKARRAGPRRDADSPLAQLTATDLTIVQLVTDGLSNRQIGEAIHLGEETIKKRLGSIMRQFGVNNRVKVAVLAVLHGYAPRGGEPDA